MIFIGTRGGRNASGRPKRGGDRQKGPKKLTRSRNPRNEHRGERVIHGGRAVTMADAGGNPRRELKEKST